MVTRTAGFLTFFLYGAKLFGLFPVHSEDFPVRLDHLSGISAPLHTVAQVDRRQTSVVPIKMGFQASRRVNHIDKLKGYCT
jgi:hypothetical protein